MRPFSTTTRTLVLLAILATPVALRAQEPRKSQRGTVSQTVNRTVISVTYDRPSARDRTLFGEEGVVLNDALWTPGANRATILEFSTDVDVAGKPVPAGKYSVWLIPAAGEWTLILNSGWDTNHAIYPGEANDVLRTPLASEAAEHMETLAFYFPVVEAYRAVLRIHWGETAVSVPIEVER